MGWIFNNPLGTMYGPYFLIFYIFVITITIVVCVFLVGEADKSLQARPILMPAKPDPFEIAYLRGGSKEVARLIIYDLLQRHILLQIANKPSTLRATEAQPDTEMPYAYSEMYRFFNLPKSPHTVLTSPVMTSVEKLCLPYANSAAANRFVLTTEEKSRIAVIRQGGILTILALGLYKLVAALSTGHNNVGFLICLAVLGPIFLYAACKAPALSRRGKEHLKSIQTAFNQLRRKPGPPVAVSSDISPLLVVGLFGFAALAGTDQATYAKMFSQSGTSSGCGSGSDSGGGGGCGGGGGGGGGCGGCGGGG